MAYATVTQLRDYLGDQSRTVADNTLQAVLDRATAIIDSEIGYSFSTATVRTIRVYANGSGTLKLPYHTPGSVTAVVSPLGLDVPAYTQQDGSLIVTGGVYSYNGPFSPFYPNDGLIDGWYAGMPYDVTATFGYASVPLDIEQACLELAVTIWRQKDVGFSNVIGTETGVGYEGAYPAKVKRILELYRNKQPRLGVV